MGELGGRWRRGLGVGQDQPHGGAFHRLTMALAAEGRNGVDAVRPF
jgi:hypothetical protein